MSLTCPVCGYEKLYEPAYSRRGNPSFEYCPCCVFQFGVTDDDKGYTYEQWRKKWISEGMVWDSLTKTHPPDGWDPVKQLEKLKANDYKVD
jgi:hypothetical protein